jgi:translation initiation factor 2 subunit 2
MSDVDSVPAAELDLTLKKKKKKSSSKKEASPDDVDQVTDLMNDLSTKKKKKKSSSSKEEAGDDADATADGDAPDFEFKKKKKKKSKSAASDFDAQLKEAGVKEEKQSQQSQTKTEEYLSVNERGEKDFTYEELLSKFFTILRDNNPELASDRTGQKYKIPPPSVIRDGKKSIFANIKEISDRMHRPTEHVIQFLFAELGTSGSVDGSARLVIKGRYMPKQLETVLRKYITEYVLCKTCKSINTKLSKENRIYFLECNSCGSRRSVASIKTGYQAIIRRPR